MDVSGNSPSARSLLRTCVSEEGKFIFGIHEPHFEVRNLREKDFIRALGRLPDGDPVYNNANFPKGDIKEEKADTIYEVPNPFPFRGTTYINSAWADYNARHNENIRIKASEPFSFKDSIKKGLDKTNTTKEDIKGLYTALPRPLRIAIAESSSDPEELVALAETVCRFKFDKESSAGLSFKTDGEKRSVPDIKDHTLYEIIANNPHLPDEYKRAMILAPGIQGTSGITADKHKGEDESHVYEYLRMNSYIPWGHFAANMADNSVRYSAGKLSVSDMEGMRHLYYQRTYIRLAEQLDIPLPEKPGKGAFSVKELEQLRSEILKTLSKKNIELEFNRSLWGWNFGFGFSHSGYNLHASHQQIHQQFAMIPRHIPVRASGSRDSLQMPSYACGDLVENFVRQYRKATGKDFFKNYLDAVNSNTRTDGNKDREKSLIVHEDENVMLFVPKAQTSQFELQLMPKNNCGNILEADTEMRGSFDRAILKSIKALESLGAQMVTSIEFSKRFDLDKDFDQNIFYSFLPKVPMSPGAFSEAQLRFITGHYPEDFASACRSAGRKR